MEEPEKEAEELNREKAVQEESPAKQEAVGTPEESIAENEAESKKEIRGKGYLRILRNVLISLLIAAAVVVLIENYVFPVMRIYGSSMSATLVDGDIVIAHKTTELSRGDIIAFYYGSGILCKRVVGVAGDEITMDDSGTVYINGEELEEPYLKGKSLGECDVEFPITVPENSFFVLGDNRRASIDSRNTVIGCVSEEQVVGRILFCILPLPSFGRIA